MLGSWLDNIYGAWFLPERTFRALREQPVLWQAFGVVGLLNVLEAIRRSGASLPSMVLAVLMGSLGWVSLAALLQLLAFCLGRAAPSFSALLCLTGFAGCSGCGSWPRRDPRAWIRRERKPCWMDWRTPFTLSAASAATVRVLWRASGGTINAMPSRLLF